MTTGPCPHDPSKQCPRDLSFTIQLAAAAEITSTEQANNRIKLTFPSISSVLVKPNTSINPTSLPDPSLGENTHLTIHYRVNNVSKTKEVPLTVTHQSNKFWIIHKAEN